MKAADNVVPVPVVAWLGYGGLLPFVALAAASLLRHYFHGQSALALNGALLAYGSVILSFVGALHWAFAMTLRDLSANQRAVSFVWSVMPALLAWLALLLTPAAASALLVAGFCVHYWRDARLAANADLPGWYLPMRLRLTSVACLCLTVPLAQRLSEV